MDTPFEITDGLKHDVLAATDLVALVGAVTGLKKAGNSWKGLCPFHGEKTPSFHVHPEKGFYYCFGCGAKGDAITFVRETEKLEFPEAIAYLARRAGIPLPLRRSGSRADRAKETRATEALLAAAKFFREQLGKSAAARAVLEGRGVPEEEWEALGFGAAPDAWDGLSRALSGTFPEEVLLEAGLLQKNQETGRVYDRFRNRLTLEIRDPRGEVLAFGGRALGDDPAKVKKFLKDPDGYLSQFPLSEAERRMVRTLDVKALDAYGVSNLFKLEEDTHKFERYANARLIGPLPQAAQKYRDWSPEFHADSIRDPLAIFQGADDPVVPKSQSDAIAAALQRNRVPHLYRVYPGEGHRFRKSETRLDFILTMERFLVEQFSLAN